MKVYIAAPYPWRNMAIGVMQRLEEHSHVVTSRWLQTIAENSDASARADLDDVASAEVLLVLNSPVVPPRRLPGIDDVEVWKNIPDSRLNYEVSSFGRIRKGDDEIVTGKRNHGYVRVLPNGKQERVVSVHQLVAQAFLGPCPPEFEIDHLDGYKDNNWVGNLEYVTHLENVRRALKFRTGDWHAGENNSRAKLSFNDVADIRARAVNGETYWQIAKDYDVCDTTVKHIIIGKIWPINDRLNSGGKEVELGYALGRKKHIILVGQRSNIFHYLDQVHAVATFEEALTWLTSLAQNAAP